MPHLRGTHTVRIESAPTFRSPDQALDVLRALDNRQRPCDPLASRAGGYGVVVPKPISGPPQAQDGKMV